MGWSGDIDFERSPRSISKAYQDPSRSLGPPQLCPSTRCRWPCCKDLYTQEVGGTECCDNMLCGAAQLQVLLRRPESLLLIVALCYMTYSLNHSRLKANNAHGKSEGRPKQKHPPPNSQHTTFLPCSIAIPSRTIPQPSLRHRRAGPVKIVGHQAWSHT